ncbi:hypothetical protein KKH23_00755 [Patescibacteria group bacterium]|nr:hypothetical protein [Patescibacteria group bacterium]MBU0777278.1 hypothetical protein [Patescibacteria group bacterium]MBU0845724.1 hypothetical protein [Patescibacteria group bacterium]MBU0923045.1 hypothetical protein [Patescibacteria group bacterium]MBU1066596.1 hypothetical protein [Patescibacteria group bacterium]
MTKRDKKRFNTHFRQTVKEFKAARQTQIYSHLKRNIPYKIFKISKPQFLSKVKKSNILKRKKLTFFGKQPFKMKQALKKGVR